MKNLSKNIFNVDNKQLTKNTNIILITLLISIICEIFFETTSNYDHLILKVLCLFSKFGNKKSTCIFMIITSVILVVESIIGFSLNFNAVFLVLGIVGIYHSIYCLKIKRYFEKSFILLLITTKNYFIAYFFNLLTCTFN